MAFCNQCGTQIEDNATVCPACGAAAYQPQEPPVMPEAPVFRQTAAEPVAATVSPSKVLTFGIIGLALSELGIPGIILSCIARKLANTFEKERGMIFGQAKVGRILAKVGFIVGIVMTVVWIIYAILFVLLMINAVYHRTVPYYLYW